VSSRDEPAVRVEVQAGAPPADLRPLLELLARLAARDRQGTSEDRAAQQAPPECGREHTSE
jgi:hypothetical protein